MAVVIVKKTQVNRLHTQLLKHLGKLEKPFPCNISIYPVLFGIGGDYEIVIEVEKNRIATIRGTIVVVYNRVWLPRIQSVIESFTYSDLSKQKKKDIQFSILILEND